MLAPSTIFHTVISFMTNTDLQHYSGDQHFSNFSQLFFDVTNFFLSAAIGFCALTAIIRALRSESSVGNFFVDMWRVVAYMFLPLAFVASLVFLQQGTPMTFTDARDVQTLEPAAMGTTDAGEAKAQTIRLGPLAAFVPMKQLARTAAVYGMNSAHPFENPTAITNFVSSA
jgi:K+-transporting ATPase ATPase A chain